MDLLKIKNIEQIKRQLEAMKPKYKTITLYAGAINGAVYPKGTRVEDVFIFNEYGHVNYIYKGNGEVSMIVTPPRPIKRPVQEKESPKWEQMFIDLYESGKTIEEACQLVNNVMVKDVKTAIIEIDTPPNTENTQSKKGFDDPWIHTRWLLTNISGEIEYKK